MKIKICGVTTLEDAAMVAASGADWVGLNFHPTSPRLIGEAAAREIVAILPPLVEAVGLFVNRDPHDVADIAHCVGLRILQLHGDEPLEDLQALGTFRVIRAFRIGSEADIEAMCRFVDDARIAGCPLEAVLVDARVTGQFGGTGRSIPDHLLDHLRPLLPTLPRVILAGGLTIENVARNVARLGPWMVDAASGVETCPGRKDAALVRDFIRTARQSRNGGEVSSNEAGGCPP